MIPAELEARIIDLPAADNCRIVIFTGTELRHDRFALRLQSEFPGLVAAWLQVVPASQGVGFLRRTTPQGPVEQRLFGDEIERLRKAAYVAPTIVQNPNSIEVIASIKALDPYFILTLGGSMYSKALCCSARGLALNQHDGWCPEYRGSNTVYWALYHRDLPKVSNTIHILTDGMDSGPILRRSSACLAVDDTPESCFARSVALGTELMCETVRELIQTKRARICGQPQLSGYTYIFQHMTDDVMRTVETDLQRGLIRNDIARRTKF